MTRFLFPILMMVFLLGILPLAGCQATYDLHDEIFDKLEESPA